MKKKFPKGFLWGVAHSSHQVEGNNSNNDWWRHEEQGNTKDLSGWACDVWNRYPLDNELASELGCDGFRFSLEWSRIEPKEGKFSQEAIEHYRKVLQDLKRRGIRRVLTLNHWTLPIWFADKYGWHHIDTPKVFAKFCKKVLQELGDEIDLFITLNEPTIPLNKGYLVGIFPPNRKNPFLFWKARKNMILAHKKCYKLVKEIRPNLPVGITQYCSTFEVDSFWRFLGGVVARFQNFYNWGFLDAAKDCHDFIGVDYYATFALVGKYPFFERRTTKKRWSDMKWGIYPQGLFDILMSANKKYKKPIYVFENGLADEKDKYRTRFIIEHVKALQDAQANGVDVRGYFYWSFLDNFEWNQGYGPKFGLCAVNQKTFEREPRPSFFVYKKLIAKNKSKSVRGEIKSKK